MTLDELNAIGENNLRKNVQEVATTEGSKVVSIDELVSQGIVEEASVQAGPSEAEQFISDNLSVDNIKSRAEARAEVLKEKIQEQVDEKISQAIDKEVSSDVEEADEDYDLEKEVLATDDDDDEDYIDEVEKELAEEAETVTPSISIELSNESKSTEVVDDNFDKDLAELDADNSNDAKEDESIKKLQSALKGKFAKTVASIDLSSYSVVNKPINVNAAVGIKTINARDWVLYRTGIPVTMREFEGPDIELLSTIFNPDSNVNINGIKRGFQLIYDHIVSDKGDSLIGFLKCVSYYDLDHIFFSIYNTNYADANYIPHNCEDKDCGNVFVDDDMPIMKMVKFKNDEAKAKFNKIAAMDAEAKYSATRLYVSEVVPISTKYAVSFKEPSIHSIFFETSIITDSKFRSKYAATINMLPYIDKFYKLDNEAKTIREIDYKKYPTDPEKDVKSKIITFAQVLKDIPSDEYSIFEMLYSNARNEFEDEITYVMPETVCPKCDKKIEEIPSSGAQLVFTRHRLPALSATSKN